MANPNGKHHDQEWRVTRTSAAGDVTTGGGAMRAHAIVADMTKGGIGGPLLRHGSPASYRNGGARLVFGMDATGSRGPSWETAIQVQGAMFEAVDAIGGLLVKLVHFGGGVCHSTQYMASGVELARVMRAVRCRSGGTQIGEVLVRVLEDCAPLPVNAFVYIGDCMEEREEALLATAAILGRKGVRGFFFQEGGDSAAAHAYQAMAHAMNGAYCQLGPGSAAMLKDLLSAVAVYARGGEAALKRLPASHHGARLLLGQMR